MMILLLVASVAYGQVIGLDFGSEFFKASLISPGKTFVILENMTTKRKTESAISFYNQERLYESDGASKKTKSPRNTFLFLNKFLGALADNQEIIEISKSQFEDYLFERDPRRGTFQFVVGNLNIDDKDTLVMKVEEIVAMILKYVVRLADFHHKVTVKQIVITVPSDWSISQRTCLKSAAAIADLELLGIINENSAAAIYYGLERQDNTTHSVLFYNIGSYNLQVTLVDYLAFNSTQTKKMIETVKIIADHSVANLGGNAFDLALANYFAKQFDAQPSRQGRKSIYTNVKAFQKLIKASNKYKEILSANKDAPVYIEGLADGEDFQSSIQRGVFEDIVKDITSRLTQPIEYVLEKAGRTKESINVVELIGGGIRVPKVQQTLNEYFGGQIEVGTHLNGDESMALGAAFHAANLSHSFKVRPIHFYDGFSFNWTLDITGEDYNKSFDLFGYKKKYGSIRNFEFSYDKELNLSVGIVKDGVRIPFATYHLTNISNGTTNGFVKPQVQLAFKITSNEFFRLEEAELKVEEHKQIEIQQKNKSNETTDSKNETEQANKEEESKKNDESKSEEVKQDEPTEEPKQETTSDDAKQEQDVEKPDQPKQDNANNLKEEVRPKYKIQKIIHTFPINYTTTYHIITGLNTTEIEDAKKIVTKFEDFEEKSRKFSEVKNQLESFVYNMREINENQNFVKLTTEAERETIRLKVEEIALFLESDEAITATVDNYTERLNATELIMKPIHKRNDEHKARPAAINETITRLQEFSKKAASLNATHSWISEERRERLFSLISNASEWVQQKLKEQEQLAFNQDPAFLTEDLKKQIDPIAREYAKLKNIPRPKVQLSNQFFLKPPKEEKKEEKKEESKKRKEKDSKKQEQSKDSSEQKQEQQNDEPDTKEPEQKEQQEQRDQQDNQYGVDEDL